MTLENCRPADCAGRLEKEIRVYDLLDTLGISYERVDHQAAMTMEDCREVDEALQSQICKRVPFAVAPEGESMHLLLCGLRIRLPSCTQFCAPVPLQSQS